MLKILDRASVIKVPKHGSVLMGSNHGFSGKSKSEILALIGSKVQAKLQGTEERIEFDVLSADVAYSIAGTPGISLMIKDDAHQYPGLELDAVYAI